MTQQVHSGSPGGAVLPPQPMSYERFLQWADEDTHAEWVNGEVHLMPAVSDEHAAVALFLKTLLGCFVDHQGLGVIRDEPFQMKLGPDLPGRSPDVFFVSKENLSRLREKHLDGPADVAIEVISRESRVRDRGEKFYEYESAGVREYWLMDPQRRQAEFYRLGGNGVYSVMAIGADGIFRSEVIPGFLLKPEWLWQRPLPPVVGILKQWGLL